MTSVERTRVAGRKRVFGRLALALLLGISLTLVVVDVLNHGGAGADEGLRTSFSTKTRADNPSEPAGEGPALRSTNAAPDVHVPEQGTGSFITAPGQSPVFGSAQAPLRTYQVAVEDGIEQDAAAFAAEVDAVLGDGRSWIAGGDVAFQRVDDSVNNADFVIYLASPKTVDQLCYPLDTAGYTSCRVDNKVVVNLARWLLAVPEFPADLTQYRGYVINHEVGHRLGYEHETCPGDGQLAPVMQQQTLGMAGCAPNPWPYVDGARYSGPPA